MTLCERIQLADRTEDAAAIRKILEILRFKYRANYAECREVFGRAGIDPSRYEELCQLADYSS